MRRPNLSRKISREEITLKNFGLNECRIITIQFCKVESDGFFFL
jgi:hypothetical protein